MEIGRIQQNQEIFSAILNIICIATIAAIIQLIIPIPHLGLLLFIPLFGYNLIKIILKIKFNSKQAIFDLSVPITFEPGSLIFKSQTDTHAIFFALSLRFKKQRVSNLKRTLLLLLKVLPEDSIIATEWTSENQCYLTFYLKFLKTEIIAKAKALIDSIKSSFQEVFGADNVQLLDDEEVTPHLTLGIPGKIQKVSKKGKYTVIVQTNETQRQVSFLEILSSEKFDFPLFFQQLREYTKPYRIIFMAKKIPNQTQMHTTMVLTGVFERSQRSRLSNLPEIKIRYLRSEKLIHQLGDIFTRNIVKDAGQVLDFPIVTERLLAFFQTGIKSMVKDKIQSVDKEQTHISKQEWRNYLLKITRELGLAMEINPFTSMDGVPLRMDAKIGKNVIKIILGEDQKQLKWLEVKLKQFLQSKGEDLILLLCNPSVSSFFDETQNSSITRNKLHLITSKSQLKQWLQSLKSMAKDQIEVAVEVC